MFCKKCGARLEENGGCPVCLKTTKSESRSDNSGLAKASMIIGIISLAFGIIYILPLTGLILGICALLKIRKGIAGGKSMAMAGVILNILGLAAGGIATYRIYTTMSDLSKHLGGEFSLEKAGRKMMCIGQLVQIDAMCNMYAVDNGNYLPDKDGAEGLNCLLRECGRKRWNIHSLKQGFICPAFKGKNMAALLPGVSENQISYVYFGGFNLQEGRKMKILNTYIPVLFDYPGNHKGYVNLIYLNGEPDSIITDAKNCVELISELQKKHKYSSATIKLLMEKAAKADQERKNCKISDEVKNILQNSMSPYLRKKK